MSLLNILTDPKNAAFVALSGVLLSALLSTIVAFGVSRRSIYINSVTAERSKWIDELRNNISALIGNYSLFIASSLQADYSHNKDYIANSKEVGLLIAKIKMQLNPNGRIDQNMLSLLTAMQMQFRDITFDYHRAERLLIEHSQWLFKEEWERVKYEASGWLRGVWSSHRRRLRLRRYSLYASSAGAVGDLQLPIPPKRNSN